MRVNIYLDDPELRTAIEIAAAHHGVTISQYCLEAIRRRFAEDGGTAAPEATDLKAIGRAMDEFRQRIGPIGMSVTDLIAEGRR